MVGRFRSSATRSEDLLYHQQETTLFAPSARRSRKALPLDITVYSKPLCVQCDATKRALNKAGVAYDVVDITEDADALARIKSMGYVQAPVVITEQDHWSGFRPDKIKALSAGAGAERRATAI